jgi:hypothetical protein
MRASRVGTTTLTAADIVFEVVCAADDHELDAAAIAAELVAAGLLERRVDGLYEVVVNGLWSLDPDGEPDVLGGDLWAAEPET